MKSEVRGGFLAWVAILFTGIFSVMFVLFVPMGEATIETNNKQFMTIFAGILSVVIVLLCTMHLDKKVKDPKNRVYR